MLQGSPLLSSDSEGGVTLRAGGAHLGGSPDARRTGGEIGEGEYVMSQAEHDRRIDYIEFPADDIEEAKRFYAAVFGWEFTDYGPTYTSFQDGRLSGGFTTDATVAKGGPLVVIYATNLEAISARVIEHGGEVTKEPFEFPGGRRFHFKDPNGNELAVWSEQ